MAGKGTTSGFLLSLLGPCLGLMGGGPWHKKSALGDVVLLFTPALYWHVMGW